MLTLAIELIIIWACLAAVFLWLWANRGRM
jgi:hypothetical protein